MKKLMVVVAAMAAVNAFGVQGTLVREVGGEVSGDIKWQPVGKKYVVTKGNISLEVQLADVVGYKIDEPPTFAKAREQVENGQGSAAVNALKKIVDDYKMLQWDNKAGRWLARAYLDAGKVQEANDLCKAIIRDDKTAAYRGDLAYSYWQTMLRLGKSAELEKLLEKAAASGDRASSAAALVMRGDIILESSGNAPEKVKQALRDGYLRVYLMYRDAECAEVRKEACEKAAQAFEKIGRTLQAQKIRDEAKAM